ncbi:MAG: HAD-IIIA family hydrolase [Chitinophagaceae bacterium]|nr:HAD-IIIA family hydrolase [Chitinophagaceae bacterium]
MKKAVFIDKDGTLIRNIPFNVDPRYIEWLPGAVMALEKLQQARYLLLLVSNQPGISLGAITESALHRQYLCLAAALRRQHIQLRGFYYCPHHPAGSGEYACYCMCRKPLPGMLLRAAMEWGIDLRQSWMIGDILDDVEAGNKAKCKTILLNQGNETEWLKGRYRTPGHIGDNWKDIARIICP